MFRRLRRVGVLLGLALSVVLSPLDTAVAAPAAQPDSCVEGSWWFQDHDGIWKPLRNFQVQVWDVDTLAPNNPDFLTSGLTNEDGYYHLCFSSEDDEDPFIKAQDVKVRFVSENGLWRLQEKGTGAVFGWDLPVVNSLAAGATHDFDALSPTDPKWTSGLRAFDVVNDVWKWRPIQSACWDPKDPPAACRQLKVTWRWDSTTGDYYSTGQDQVFLKGDQPSSVPSRDLIAHEVAHAIMDDFYGDNYPNPNPPGAVQPCSAHDGRLQTSPQCAWIEGFAFWMAGQVNNHAVIDYFAGATLDIETPTWGTPGFEVGEAVDGRVAAALRDISDSAPNNEGTWDRYGEGPANIWSTVVNHRSESFSEFWLQRMADGFNTAATGARASAYQSTIDMEFRDPLASGVPVVRPTPLFPHNYQVQTTTKGWSVVAVRPPAAADYDLDLYRNFGQAPADLMKQSQAGPGIVDFIAIDTTAGKQLPGLYFPRMWNFNGASGSYVAEWQQATQTLPAGTTRTVSMLGNDLVAVFDSDLTANAPVTITASGSPDVELYLMTSTTGAAPWVRSRLQAHKVSSGFGAGGTEKIQFTPTASGRYGVVVIKKSGSGTVTVTRT